MLVLRNISSVVMIVAFVAAVLVLINNVMDPSSVPTLLKPVVELLPEQGSTASFVVTGVVVAVVVVASTITQYAKKSLRSDDSAQ